MKFQTQIRNLIFSGLGLLYATQALTDSVSSNDQSLDLACIDLPSQRLKSARIDPVDIRSSTPEQLSALKAFSYSGPPLNIFRTIANAPEAAKPFNAWGSYIMGEDSSLTPREREIVILRIGARLQSRYEFYQHAKISLHAGLSRNEINSLNRGDLDIWSSKDAMLITASDEIVDDFFISEETWQQLRGEYSQRKIMDIVFTATQYIQVSVLLNSFGVQLEDEIRSQSSLTNPDCK